MGDRSLVRDVCIVSDNPSARVLVSSLVTMMGHRPVDYGELARWMLVTAHFSLLTRRGHLIFIFLIIFNL